MWRWFRIGLAAAAVLLLLLAVWAPAEKRGPGVPSRAVVVNQSGGELPIVRSIEAPDLLVDRRNSRLVYLSAVELTSGACKFYVSIDGGTSWRAENAPQLEPYSRNCALGSASPQNVRTELAQGSDGTLFYVFQGNDPDAGGSRSVLLGRSIDGGRTWETVAVEPGPKAASIEEVELNYMAHVAVDPRNPKLVYVMWRRSYPVVEPGVRPKPTRPYFALSQDGGASFGPATLLVDSDVIGDGPRPLVVGNSVYAFYRQSPPALPAASAAPAPTPPLTRLFVAASSDHGQSWARSEIAAARDASEPVPAYDAKRKQFYVVWHDNRREELDVWFSASPDGISWSAPKQLNDDPPNTRVGQHYPQLSISPQGRIDVAWYDWRDDPFPAPSVGPGNVLSLFTNRGKVASVYLTSSRDGGESWDRNVRVNDELIDRTVGTWANNYDVLAPPAIVSARSSAVVAWSDTRNATELSQSQDLAVARVVFERKGQARVTGLQAAVVGVLVGAGLAMWAALLIVRRPVRGRPAPGRERVPAPPAAVP